jgi:plasmid stabilization system protein ParE
MAKLPLRYHPEARAEAFDAFEWYRLRSSNASRRFQQQLELAQGAIQDSPESWAAYLHGTRRYQLKRYPYLVVFRIQSNQIDIIAVAHGRRRPGYWRDRLRSDF